MSVRLHPLWVIVIAGVALTAGLLGGYELRGSSSSPGAPSANSGSPVLSITGAGTLGTAFPALASLLVNQSTGAQAPSASQTYQGSLAALGLIATSHDVYDVAAAADFRLIPHLLEPTYANWEVVFATNPEVLVYDPSVAALSGINSSNWGEKVQSAGVVLGVANATTDPNGYNGIFVLQLEGLAEGGSLASLYSHFYTGAPGSPALPVSSTAKLELETQVSTLISTHVVSAFITYRSYAVTHHLSYVSLDPSVGLGNFSSEELANYALASTQITAANGSLTTIRGAPVAFSA
ncbi:MAG: substrate-binding domain-containing protein, partial [Thermoplasmata archaeon]|nr:substrate-binding domain-containing protein [Thermoplasmata archaeon]